MRAILRIEVEIPEDLRIPRSLLVNVESLRSSQLGGLKISLNGNVVGVDYPESPDPSETGT